MQQNGYSVAFSVEVHQCSLGYLRRLRVRHGHVFHRGAYGLVPKTLANQGEVYVASYEVGGQGVLQGVRVALLGGQAGSFGGGLEDAEELRAVEPSTLLRSEEEVRAVRLPSFQPSPQSRHFIKEWLALVPEKGLDGVERAFQAADRHRTSLEVHVSQLEAAYLRGPHPVTVAQQDHGPIPGGS